LKASHLQISFPIIRVGLPILIALSFVGCDYRSRSNPFDPANEITKGKPTGLTISSRMDTVQLTWADLNYKNLDACAIYRSDSLDAAPVQVGTVLAPGREFLDTGLTYEKMYAYRISALADNFESQLSDPVTITPGPTFTWILEYATGAIIKLSHDCLHSVFQTNYNGYPEKIAVDPVAGTAWVSDEFLNRIYHINPNGRLLQVLEKFNRILDIEIDPRTGGLWLVDGQHARVVKLNSNGETVFSYSNLARPTCLAVEMQSGNCWLVDAGAGKIFRIEPNGNMQKKVEFPFLGVSAIGVHETSGTLWLADSLRLLRVQDQQVEAVAALRLLELAVDPSDGSCWVGARNGISKFSHDGALKFTRDGDFYDPVLAVNPFNHACLIADKFLARLTQISGDGAETKIFSTLSYPSAVAVEYRTRR
jgi:hypothetical protein